MFRMWEGNHRVSAWRHYMVDCIFWILVILLVFCYIQCMTLGCAFYCSYITWSFTLIPYSSLLYMCWFVLMIVYIVAYMICWFVESDHVKTNLVHKLYQVKGFGSLKLEELWDLLLGEHYTTRVNRCNENVWYPLTLDVFTQFLYKVRFLPNVIVMY